MIFVCNLHEMPTNVGVLRPSHLVSLVTLAEQPPTPEGILIERHLRIEIDDITEPIPGAVLPERHHVEDLIAFMRVWKHDDDPLLIHCVAGVSRSMASALIALVLKAGGREAEPRRPTRSGPTRPSKPPDRRARRRDPWARRPACCGARGHGTCRTDDARAAGQIAAARRSVELSFVQASTCADPEQLAGLALGTQPDLADAPPCPASS